MPTYTINGKRITTATELTDDQIEEIAVDMGAKPTVSAKPVETPKPQETSILGELARQVGLTGRAAVSGITAPFSAAADAMASLYNLGTGSNVPLPSQAQSKLMTKMGVPEPRPGLETAVQTGAESIAGVGGQAKMAQLAATKALAPLTQNLGTQAATAGASGFAGQATADKVMETTDNPLLATVAAMAVGTTAGTLASKGVNTATKGKTPDVSLDDIKQQAQRSYTKMENLGVNAKPQSVLNMLDNTERKLLSSNFNPQMDAHRPVQLLVNQLREMTGTQRVPFTKLEQMRSAATDMANAKDAATRKYAKIVVASIDDYMSTIGSNDVMGLTKGNAKEAVEAVKSARKDWRNLARANSLEDVLDTAELRSERPGASESELIRQGLINLAANKDKMRNFSETERAAIKSVIKGSFADPLLTLAAKFNPERNQIVMGGTVAAGMANPAVAASVAAGGYAADKIQSAMRTKATKDLVTQVATGTVKPQPTNYNWRALLESLPTRGGQ